MCHIHNPLAYSTSISHQPYCDACLVSLLCTYLQDFGTLKAATRGPLLRIPDLYDASPWSVDDEKESQPGAVFARAVPRFLATVVGGPLPMNVLHHLYPATLGVTVTCIRQKKIPIQMAIPMKDLCCPFISNHTHTCHAFVIFRISHKLAQLFYCNECHPPTCTKPHWASW